MGGAIIPVGDARSALPGLLVETHTHKIGLIAPPPDIRAIVDKTAQFVARNGVEFEKRILANEATNAKFNFLREGDPYNAYYKRRVEEFTLAENGEPAMEASKAAAAAAAAGPEPPALTTTPAVVPPTTPLEEPEKVQYSVPMPEGMTTMDLDCIKLTAQFVARNGKHFLTGVASREHANPQFNFLKPTHSLFAIFTALTDAYSRVLMPPKGVMHKLQQDVDDSSMVLERALKRLEWERVREKEVQEARDEAEAERMAMLSIDWHDFATVETIDFYDDEDAELPPPMTLKDLIRASKATGLESPGGERSAGLHAPMDSEEQALVAQAQATGQPTASGAPRAAAEEHEEDMDMEMSDDDEEPARVVKNYRRPDLRQQAVDTSQLVVSPITGELIPVKEMAEHMRISLIDPRWREQRDIMLSKIRETTKAGDDEIGRNLTVLAKTRPDIFGSTQEELQTLVGKHIEEQRLKEAAEQAAAKPARLALVAGLPPPASTPMKLAPAPVLPPPGAPPLAPLPAAATPPLPQAPPTAEGEPDAKRPRPDDQ